MGFLSKEQSGGNFWNSHWLPVLLLAVFGTFFFFIDGFFSFNPRLETFVRHPFSRGYVREDTDIFSAEVEFVNNPGIFSEDTFLNVHLKMYPLLFSRIVAFPARFVGVEQAFVFCAYFANLIFWVGLYFLFHYFSGCKWASTIVAWAVTLYSKEALATVRWGLIKPGRFIPRTLVLSLSPLIIYFFLRWSKQLRVAVLFLALGLLSNIHPITAGCLALILGFLLVFTDLRGEKYKLWLICATGFAVGALPFIFTIPRRFSVTSASVPKEIVDFRISYLYPPSLDGLRQWFRQWFIIPAVLGVLGFLVQVFGVGLRKRDLQLLGFFAFSLLLSSLAYLLPVTGSLFSVNTLRPMRLSVHFFTVFFVYSAVFFAWVLRLKPKVLRLFSVVLLPFFMFSQFDVLNAYVFHLPVKTFEKLTYSSDEASDGSQEVENKKNTEEVAESDQNTEVADKDSGLDISDESVGESNKVSKKEVSKNKESADNKSFDFRKMVGPQDDWEAFFALCDWFNKNTPVDSLVLIPPQGFGLFRTFSHRAIFVCAKDGGIGCFSSKHAQIWYRRYKQVLELYQSGMTGDFISLAERENIDYAVLADARPLSLPLLFSAGPFRVYQL